ncbi:MAG: succinate dehydrogenase, hydrophobic membrane anchor protein [Rhizobiaceae bacterium]
MADMRTPLARVRGLGSAKEGTGHFWHIRVTSVALIPLAIYFIVLVISLNGGGYEEVRASLSHPFNALVLGLFILISLVHMRLGMQEIIEDYIHGEGLKVSLLILSTFFCVIVGVASIFALLKLAFGG